MGSMDDDFKSADDAHDRVTSKWECVHDSSQKTSFEETLPIDVAVDEPMMTIAKEANTEAKPSLSERLEHWLVTSVFLFVVFGWLAWAWHVTHLFDGVMIAATPLLAAFFLGQRMFLFKQILQMKRIDAWLQLQASELLAEDEDECEKEEDIVAEVNDTLELIERMAERFYFDLRAVDALDLADQGVLLIPWDALPVSQQDKFRFMAHSVLTIVDDS